MASIYALTDPRTDEVRYVGQTERILSDRLREHLKTCKYYSHHTANWLKYLLRLKTRPRIIVLEECSIEDLDSREIYWIEYGKKQGWRLTNSTIGGNGSRGRIVSPETRNKQSVRAQGKYIGEKNPFYGKQHSEETLKKQSEIKKGEKNPNGRLKEKDILEIRKLLGLKYACRQIAKRFNVSCGAIRDIKSGKTWSWLK